MPWRTCAASDGRGPSADAHLVVVVVVVIVRVAHEQQILVRDLEALGVAAHVVLDAVLFEQRLQHSRPGVRGLIGSPVPPGVNACVREVMREKSGDVSLERAVWRTLTRWQILGWLNCGIAGNRWCSIWKLR